MIDRGGIAMCIATRRVFLRTDCPRAESLGEEESTRVRLAMWEIEVEEKVEGMVEGVFGRVMEAERARAAAVIQRKWLDRVYRPDSSSSTLRGVKRNFAEMQGTCL